MLEQNIEFVLYVTNLDQTRDAEKRNMAELHHMSHEHPLLFNQDTTSPSDTTYDCAGCMEKVFGSNYSCEECRYYLHKKCAEAPMEIQHHAAHPRYLLLRPALGHQESEVCCTCSICHEEVNGFSYHCSSCEFYLDFNCALLPHYTSAGKFTETLHVAHPHPLISINGFRYSECDGCGDQIKTDDASYACFECRAFFHKKCLEVPSPINHPSHRTHRLVLDFNTDSPVCSLCQTEILHRFVYNCVPCKFNIHVGCATPPTIIQKSLHEHPFTLLLRPNDPFYCNACGDKGNHVSYICSTCNFQVHRGCISLPRHIRLNFHPHPISHCFFVRTDHTDSRDWDCKICFEKVNTEHGSYCCSRPGCDFVIHVNCYVTDTLYDMEEVKNPEEFEQFDFSSDESTNPIIRVIKEIKVGDDVIAAEIQHISHEHNLIFSDDIKDTKYCNGCVLPIFSSFYYCSLCDFFLHKTCAELRKRRWLWFDEKPFSLLTNGVFKCKYCRYTGSGFSYRDNDFNVGDFWGLCLRCASIPHSFTYQADEPRFIFFVLEHKGKCNACGDPFLCADTYRSKDCTFAVHLRCIPLPHTAWHKCDQHTLTLAHQDLDDYALRHYCDICEEERDPQRWFYHCETCDKAMHIECVLGKYSFIKAGSKYTYEAHPHPLTFVKNMYYYPECVLCKKPCQDLALECIGHGCKYVVHWTCIKPDFFS